MELCMSVNKVVEYDSWDLSGPPLPQRSRLYHLQPIGLNTPLVESLTSYFSRLAEAHSVSAGTLTHSELLPLNAGRRDMFACTVTARTRCFTSTLNSIGSAAARFVSAVGKLTGRTDLHYLTMLPWKPVLPTQFVTRGVAGWCPQCLNIWREAGETVYLPLLWALEVVKYCPEHCCPLRLACPCCGRPQPLLGQSCPLGYCTRCKQWLGVQQTGANGYHRSLLQPETPDWEVWVANQVKDLIRAAFDSPALLTRQQLSHLLWAATNTEGLSGFARMLGVCSSSVIAWRAGEKLPMLPVYLRIACALNITLNNLLTGKFAADDVHSLGELGVPYWRSIRLGHKQSFDVLKAERQLVEALNESPPPSLNTFQKRTGYHYGTLQKHFPALCNAICERFQQHQAQVIKTRQEEKIAEFRRIAHQLHEQGVELFVHRVLMRMSVPLSLDYHLAGSLLMDIKQELLKKKRTHT